MKRLAIITTHPIQYNAPLFAMLAQRGIIRIKVFYTWGESVMQHKYDPGFDKAIQWDIPLLEGYDYQFAGNISADPGSHHFKGIDNPTLIREIEAWKADAVLVYGWSFKSHLKAMRYFHRRIPVLFRGDSTLLGKSGMAKKLLRTILLRWVYRHIDKALYVGTNSREYFLAYGVKSRNLVFAPHAIHNERFSGDRELYQYEAAKKREELHIGREELVFLFAAKLTVDKNAELLIHAFLALDTGKAHLIIAGSGPLENHLYQTYGKIKNIHFLPFQNQRMMPVLYRMGNVFVLPSKSEAETWGLSINEAMACGIPVLVSDKCGAAIDLVKAGENGFIFKNNDAEDLGRKLKWFVENKQALNKMGERSAEIISGWTFEKTCRAVEDVLATV